MIRECVMILSVPNRQAVEKPSVTTPTPLRFVELHGVNGRPPKILVIVPHPLEPVSPHHPNASIIVPLSVVFVPPEASLVVERIAVPR